MSTFVNVMVVMSIFMAVMAVMVVMSIFVNVVITSFMIVLNM